MTPGDHAVIAALADRSHPIEEYQLLHLLGTARPITNRLDRLVRVGLVRRSVVRRTLATDRGQTWDTSSEGEWMDVHGYALTAAGLAALESYERWATDG